jgi:hypothetical protein
MPGLLNRQTQTRDDPLFGLLMKPSLGPLEQRLERLLETWIGRSPAGWAGKLSTPLFPGVDVAISIRAHDENEFAVFRTHLEHVVSSCKTIRDQIASDALETYQFYQAEERSKAYDNITSQDYIWPLIKPQKWIFQLGRLGRNLEFKSRVIIDFGWPNEHDLVAYLADTELLLLHVEG